MEENPEIFDDISKTYKGKIYDDEKIKKLKKWITKRKRRSVDEKAFEMYKPNQLRSNSFRIPEDKFQENQVLKLLKENFKENKEKK